MLQFLLKPSHKKGTAGGMPVISKGHQQLDRLPGGSLPIRGPTWLGQSLNTQFRWSDGMS